MITRGIRLGVLGGALLALAGCGGAFKEDFKDDFKDPDPVVKDSDVVERDILPLNAAEIRAYLTDTTLSHQGETRRWHVYLGKDGTLSGLSVTNKGGKERARGLWEVTPEGEICRQWLNDWGGGENGCAKVYQYGKEYVFEPVDASAPGEKAELRRTRRAGDPFKIR